MVVGHNPPDFGDGTPEIADRQCWRAATGDNASVAVP